MYDLLSSQFPDLDFTFLLDDGTTFHQIGDLIRQIIMANREFLASMDAIGFGIIMGYALANKHKNSVDRDDAVFDVRLLAGKEFRD